MNSCLSCMYGLPKIHKDNVPLRPIISTIRSATYDLAKYLAKIISLLVGQTSSYVKNSAHFSEIINHRQIQQEEMMISFDVVSLFTKVPVPETLQIIKEKLTTDSSLSDRTNLSLPTIMYLLTMCLESVLHTRRQLLPSK